MRGPDGEDTAGMTTFAVPPETDRPRKQGTGASLLVRKQVRCTCVVVHGARPGEAELRAGSTA